jgi:hypothetical protein
MKVIRCHSKKCRGKIIGNVPDKGKGMPFAVNETATSGLLAVRFRLDDNFGFQCKCGNDSRLSEQENEIIKKSGNLKNGQPATRAEIKEIWKRVQANPTGSSEKKGYVIIDGFSIEEIG